MRRDHSTICYSRLFFYALVEPLFIFSIFLYSPPLTFLRLISLFLII